MVAPAIYLPRSRPHQRKVLTAPERFKIALCGRRWNKTDAAFQAVVMGHGPYRGALPGMIDGAAIAWVVPVNKQARKVWAMLKRSLSGVWLLKNEADRRIELPNGGSVTVISTDTPDNIRSEGYDGMVFDEAAFAKAGVWKNVLRPMLIDREGWCLFITTPNGFNWFKRDIWDRAANRAGWQRWQIPTSDNPYISDAELEEAKIELGPHSYAQECGAQFVSVEGAEFPGEWFGESIWFDEWPDDGDIDFRFVALDPSIGKTDRADYSAYVVILLHKSGAMYIDADIKRRDPMQMVVDGIAFAKRFSPQGFGIESNAFQQLLGPIFEDRSRDQGLMLPIALINNSVNKIARVRRLSPYLAKGEMHFKRGSRGAELLVEQLQAFPVGDYDDGPDALEMVWRMTRRAYDAEPELPAPEASERRSGW